VLRLLGFNFQMHSYAGHNIMLHKHNANTDKASEYTVKNLRFGLLRFLDYFIKELYPVRLLKTMHPLHNRP